MIVVYCASHHDNRESLSTGELLNVMSVFLLVCIGMEQYGVYLSSNFMLSGLHPLAKDVLHSPSQIWQNKMHSFFSECTIACIQLRQPVDILNLTCINHTPHVMLMYVQHQQLYVVLLHTLDQDGCS